MLNKKALFAVALAMSVGVICVHAQIARSPFSAFGIGEFGGSALAQHHGMAGVGVSNPNYWYLNNQNPALLVFNRFTTFQSGLQGENRNIRSAMSRENGFNGNMTYLTLGLPIKLGKWSTSLSLMPYTRVAYRFTYQEPIANSTNVADITEEGSGGINQLAWSHGIALHKHFSVGVKASYLFGSINNAFSNQLSFTDQLLIYTPVVRERYNVTDLALGGGASLHLDSLFKKNYKFNIGATYDLKTNARTRLFQSLESATLAGLTSIDTLQNNISGRITLPSQYTVGASFGRSDKWVVATDVTIFNASEFVAFDGRGSDAKNGWRWALGLELTPDPAALSSYLKRMTYRAGFSTEQSPYLVNGNPLTDFGINFGFSSPVSRASSLDVALRVGRRGAISTNSIEESYFKVFFGVTFNDQWFIKRRFD